MHHYLPLARRLQRYAKSGQTGKKKRSQALRCAGRREVKRVRLAATARTEKNWYEKKTTVMRRGATPQVRCAVSDGCPVQEAQGRPARYWRNRAIALKTRVTARACGTKKNEECSKKGRGCDAETVPWEPVSKSVRRAGQDSRVRDRRNNKALCRPR